MRQDPELLDEGVDMESDHESTEEEEILEKEGQEEEEEDSGKEKSEEEESQGSSKVELVSEESALEKEGGEGGEGEVERMEEGKGKEKDEEQREWSEEDGSEKVEVKGKKGEKGRKKGKKGEVRMEEGKVDEKMSEQTKENEDMMDTDPAMSNQVSVVISGEGDDTIDEIVSQVPVPGSTSKGEGENGQDAHVKIDSNAAMIDGDGVGSEHSSHHPSKHSSSGIPTSDARTLLSECSSNKKKRKKKRKKPPWELAFDPFKPIPISQVCIHAIPTTLSYLHPFSSPFPFFPPYLPCLLLPPLHLLFFLLPTSSPLPLSPSSPPIHSLAIIFPQVFDILPIHGVLEPGASSFIHYTFYGHSDITADVVAACKVEGGPTYEIQICGEASRMHYKFSQKVVEFGPVPYDQVQWTEIVLYNRGKVAFEFFTVNVNEDAGTISPGEVAVTPSKGRILALDSITFSIAFLPGFPEQFSKSFKIQVAHFETDVITLIGKAVFPQLTLNLPRDISKVKPAIHNLARANLALPPLVSEPGESQSSLEEPAVEMEMDRLLVKEFAAEHMELFKSHARHKPRYMITI